MQLSIITPCYNAVNTIEATIRSVMAQDYQPVEHIIVDGGSTDGTVDVLKKYPHLIWKSGSDRGQCDAMNHGFTLSSGQVIGYVNADDYYAPNVFGQVMDAFTAGEEMLVYGNLIKITSNGKRKIDMRSDYHDIITRNKFPRNPVSYFYSRSIQEKIGPFPIHNHYAMDLWFLLHAFHRFKTDKIDLTLGYYRTTESDRKTATVNTAKICRREINRYLLRHDFKNYLKLNFNRYLR